MALVNIYDALLAIVDVQKSVEIDRPQPMRIREAWLTRPPQAELIAASVPCWTNSWDFLQEDKLSADHRRHDYEVHMQLHVALAGEGSNNLAAECATAFMGPILEAFGRKHPVHGTGGIKLLRLIDGELQPTVDNSNIRGGSPTLARFGETPATIGLDLILEMRLDDGFSYS